MAKSLKLDLNPNERLRIRKAGLRLAELARLSARDLSDLTGIALERCEELIALSQFQTLGSVGLRTAEDLWLLGYRKISDLADAEPAEMYQRLMRLTGKFQDPCVEDSLRCAVAQAVEPALPESLRQWWAWQDQRGKQLTIPEPPK